MCYSFDRDDRKIHKWTGDGEYVGPASSGIFDLPASKQQTAQQQQQQQSIAPAPVFITRFDWFPMAPGKGQMAADMYAAGGTDGKSTNNSLKFRILV